jgi:hypothetical protein
MSEKKVLLFQDSDSENFISLEDRLTALLFDKDMADKANDVLYTENEDGDAVISNLKTMVEIEEHLEKNGIVFETVNFEFIDYNEAEQKDNSDEIRGD